MPGLILAVVNPDNTPHGYNWTFAFPMLLFIVIAVILYALFSRPHRRVPGQPISPAAVAAAVPSAEIASAAPAVAGVGAEEAATAGEAAPEPTEDGA